MPDWKEFATQLAAGADRRIDRMRAWGAARRGSSTPLLVVPYIWYGTPHRLEVRGRVLEEPRLTPARIDDSLWVNVARMVQRFESDEVAGASVVMRFDTELIETTTDDEGYFRLALEPDEPVHTGWHDLDIGAASVRHGAAHGMARVMVPKAEAEFGVISDLDDTVIETGANQVLRMAKNVMMGNAHTRLPFGGVRELYQALQRGTERRRPVNPLFYVSNGPWNLFDFVVEFMEINDVPLGPVILRDYGFDAGKFLTNAQHKAGSIRDILDTYPDLRFLLIGDSGEKDPEIYRSIVAEFPDRIAAVYIRDVTADRRRTALRAIAADLAAHGVEMFVATDSAAVAGHAAATGFITREAASRIRAVLR